MLMVRDPFLIFLLFFFVSFLCLLRAKMILNVDSLQAKPIQKKTTSSEQK